MQEFKIHLSISLVARFDTSNHIRLRKAVSYHLCQQTVSVKLSTTVWLFVKVAGSRSESSIKKVELLKERFPSWPVFMGFDTSSSSSLVFTYASLYSTLRVEILYYTLTFCESIVLLRTASLFLSARRTARCYNLQKSEADYREE